MNTTNIFEVATRNKFRFPYKGLISVEDLWDLTPVQLDSIFKTLNKDAKQTHEDSLMKTQTSEDTELFTKIEIVKFIFNAKEMEENARKAAAENAEKRRHILDILAKKQETSLQNMSEEDLIKMLNELG